MVPEYKTYVWVFVLVRSGDHEKIQSPSLYSYPGHTAWEVTGRKEGSKETSREKQVQKVKLPPHKSKS